MDLIKDGVQEIEKNVLPDVLARVDKLISAVEGLETLLPSILDGYQINITITKKNPQ